MRLIDADKLMLSLADWELQEAPIHTYEKPKEFTADNMQEMIWKTIRDCESAVEEQPTVEAIPTQWIAKKAIDTDDQGAFTTAYLMLIEDWRKENETD